MNERIKKLIKKATTIRYSGPGEIEEFDKEKFAELIVRECATIADNRPAVLIDKTTGGLIKQHFGVEE